MFQTTDVHEKDVDLRVHTLGNVNFENPCSTVFSQALLAPIVVFAFYVLVLAAQPVPVQIKFFHQASQSRQICLNIC